MKRKIHSIVVAVDFSLASGRNFFAGILRFARLKGDWRVRILQSAAEFNPDNLRLLEAEGLDGIISTELADPDVRDYLDRSALPLVAITSPNNRLPTRKANLTYVNVDEVRIGTDAAAYFDTLGNFMTYASVRHVTEPYGMLSHGRRNGFRSAVLASGRTFHSFEDVDADLTTLAAWLQELPKPVALFAGRDTCASKVVEACTIGGINVPQQVSVLGVDNDELLCLSCDPPLSSLLPGAEDEGQAAAAELERLLNGRRHDKVREVICRTSNEVIERGSTAPVKPATELIRRALAYITAHSHEPLSVPSVVSALKVSRRLLELRFHEILNEPIGAAILRIRLDRLANRLCETTGPMSKVCRSCGFRNLTYAKAAFKRRFGTTMGEWRMAKTLLLLSTIFSAYVLLGDVNAHICTLAQVKMSQGDSRYVDFAVTGTVMHVFQYSDGGFIVDDGTGREMFRPSGGSNEVVAGDCVELKGTCLAARCAWGQKVRDKKGPSTPARSVPFRHK